MMPKRSSLRASPDAAAAARPGKERIATGFCANHPTESATTRCASCARRLCHHCWLRNVDGKPWCELCVHHLTAKDGPLALAIVFFLSSVAIIYAGLRWQLGTPGEPSWLLWICVVVGAGIGAVVIANHKPEAPERRIEKRQMDREPIVPPTAIVGHPYRAALKHSLRLVASPVSGRSTALILFTCMVIAAVAIPGALELPRWVEIEAVIAIWWLAWAVVLSGLLYRGWRVSDDHVLATPRIEWPSARSAEAATDLGCNAASGCAEAAVAVVILLITLVASWLLVELVLPALLFFAYLLIRSALARIANDDHDCSGHLHRAVWWGSFWAAVYAVPFAIAVYGFHVVRSV